MKFSASKNALMTLDGKALLRRTTSIQQDMELKLFSIEAITQIYSVKKGALRNLAKFTGKHLCQSLSFNKVAGVGLQVN